MRVQRRRGVCALEKTWRAIHRWSAIPFARLIIRNRTNLFYEPHTTAGRTASSPPHVHRPYDIYWSRVGVCIWIYRRARIVFPSPGFPSPLRRCTRAKYNGERTTGKKESGKKIAFYVVGTSRGRSFAGVCDMLVLQSPLWPRSNRIGRAVAAFGFVRRNNNTRYYTMDILFLRCFCLRYHIRQTV